MRNQTLCISSVFVWLKNLIRELIQKFIYFFSESTETKDFSHCLLKMDSDRRDGIYIFNGFKIWLKQFPCISCSVALSVGLTDFLTPFLLSPVECVSLTWSHTLFKEREGMGKSFVLDTAAASTISIPKEFQ